MKTPIRAFLPLLLSAGTLAQPAYVEQVQTSTLAGGAVSRMTFNAPSGLLVVVSADRVVRLVSATTLAQVGALPADAQRVTAFDLTASGQSLITAAAEGKLTVWSLPSFTAGKTLAPHRVGIAAVSHKAESLAFTASIDQTVKLSDITTGKTVASVSIAPDDPADVVAHPDGQSFVVITSTGKVRIFTTAEMTPGPVLQDAAGPITTTRFSADGKFLAVGTFDGAVVLWSYPDGKLLLRKVLHRGSVADLAFDATGSWLASSGTDSSVVISHAATLEKATTMSLPGAAVAQLCFVQDGTLLTAGTNGVLARWTVKREPPDTEPPRIVVEEPAPLPGNIPRRLFATQIRVRGVAIDNKEVAQVTLSGKPVALAPLGPTDTVAVPPGAFARRFDVTVSLDTVGVNTIVVGATDKVGLESTARTRIERLSQNDAVDVLAPNLAEEVDGVSTTLQVRPWFNVSTYSVTVNLIEIAKGKKPKNALAGDVISEEIPLVVGYNQVQLVVNGRTGERIAKTIGISRKYTQTVVQAPVPQTKKRANTQGPQRWAVVIGVSQYANPGIPSLTYADKDAEAFANFLRTPQGGGYDNDHLLTLMNKDATLGNVRDALINFLSQAIDIDLVVIYFAGHGAPEPARPQNLYLLTHDSDPTRLGTTAFPMWQIQDVLGRYINAKRIIVFSDACHSGGISVNFATRGVGSTEQNLVNQYLADLSRSKEGTVVFTASAAGEVSQEFPEFGHGVFTYYLLEGLRGKADYNNDYTITVNEAMQYTEEQVKRKTRGAQNPTRSQTAYDKEMTVAVIPH